MDRRWVKGMAIACVAGGAIAFFSDNTFAEIVPDSTLPANTIVTPDGKASVITGGSVRGSNLFHSFKEFSVLTNGTAYFNNSADIQNILTRVTGRSVSNIDGSIKANGTANLFLINPNGIIFGPNASLNLGGSFLASTASAIKFADGTEFNARELQSTPLLIVSVPIGLQFGNNTGSILVQGPGNNLRVDLETGEFIRENRPVGLQVAPGKTLALVGGHIALEGGNLTAVEGRVELGSVADSGLVALTLMDNGWTLGYEGVQNFQDIQLYQAASVDTSGESGGDIQLQGGRVTLANGSVILSQTTGAKPGRTLTVNSSELIELSGTSSLLTETKGAGAGGNLRINTKQLIVRDGAQISALAFSTGQGGNLSVNASDFLELIGESRDAQFASGLIELSGTSSLLTETKGAGAGGNLRINTKQLIVRDGAQVSALAFSTGQGGNLSVNASDFLELIGESRDAQFASGLFAYTQGTGSSGNLIVTTRRLIVRDGALILTATFDEGSVGTLTINASESVELMGISSTGLFSSGLFSSTDRTRPGENKKTEAGGNLSIETSRLIVQDGAQVGTSTFGNGDAGNLNIRASDFVLLSGGAAVPSGLFSQTQERGRGGNLTIATEQLIVRNGAEVSTSTFSAGNAGNLKIGTGQLIIENGAVLAGTLGEGRGGTLTVNARDSVELIGTRISADGEQLRSGLFAQSLSAGSAGDLRINTDRLIIEDGATASVSSIGTGAAGNLSIQASNIRLDNGAIAAETKAGEGGNITLKSRDIELRRNSQITTNASGTGGNITINTQTLAALEDSDVTANSVDSLGGRVIINTQGIFRQGIFGTEVRRELSPLTSDVTATSQLGPQFDGIVNIEGPSIEPNQEGVDLPEEIVDIVGLIDRRCSPGNPQQPSEFINTGRGGRPPSPLEPLSINEGWVDLRSFTLRAENKSGSAMAIQQTRSTTDRIIEAQGWIINANGQVELVAEAPTVTPYSSLSTPACNERSDTIKE